MSAQPKGSSTGATPSNVFFYTRGTSTACREWRQGGGGGAKQGRLSKVLGDQMFGVQE